MSTAMRSLAQTPQLHHDVLPHAPAVFEAEVAQTLGHDIALLLQRCAGLPCYALIEMGQCSTVDRQAIGQCARTHRLDANRLFAGTPESELADEGPWLIRLPAHPADELLDVLARHAGVHHALSFVASPLGLRELASHMKGWLEGFVPADPNIEGDEPSGAVLRWFDPRIGLDMTGCWPAADRLRFMTALRWWATWGPDFSPRLLHGPKLNAAAPRAEPLPLERPLLIALDRLNRAESMLASVRENDIEPGELDHIAPALQRWLAHRLHADAQRLGLVDWGDQYMFLAMGMRLHPDIASVPFWRRACTAASAGQRSLSEAIEDVDADLLQQLAQDAPRALALHSQALLEPLRQRRLAAAPSHLFHVSHTEAR